MTELYKMFPRILDLPPESPDLSPIENLWNYLKDRLSDKQLKNLDELFTALKVEWDWMTPNCALI